MSKRMISLLTIVMMLFSALYLPVYAEADTAKIIRIAGEAYDNNLKQLSPIQQQDMQNLLRNIENKMLGDPEGHISMAYMSMVTNGTDPKAQAVLAAWGARKYPKALCLVNNLGYALHLLKDYGNAAEIYRKALGIDGESLETIVNLGNVYMDMDRDEDAKKTYESALKIDEEYYKAWEGLYGYYMKKKQYDKAMEIIAKMKPPGFVQRARDRVQEEMDKESNDEKLEHIDDGDSLEVMEQKIDKITRKKPLNLAPIVEEIDPDMAQKIREEMGSLKVTVKAPDNPWPVDFSNAKNHYITSKGYEDSTLMPEEILTPQIDPEILEKGEQIAGMSDSEIDRRIDNFLNNAGSVLENVEDMDLYDYSQLMEALGSLRSITESDIFADLPSTQGNQQASGQASATSTEEQLGKAEKDGIVTTGNYYNYTAHKNNFEKYLKKINTEFAKKENDVKQRFDDEMKAVRKKQDDKRAEYARQGKTVPRQIENQWTRERNSVRDKYVKEYGDMLSDFYRSHVSPAIEKVENAQALYIKNMANKKLKNMQAEQMKAEMSGFLQRFAKAKAPVDDYEPESDAADRELQEQIEKLKANAPMAGQPLPKLKDYEDGQKSLLEKIYEDVKYEASVGLVKVTFHNNELTIGLNDPLHDEYMDFSVNFADSSVSLTEGKGSEVGFTVAMGAKGTKLEGIDASIGLSNRQAGQRTTLYFDGLKVVDAEITQTASSEQGFSSGVGIGKLSLKGGVKIETTAEGTSQFVSSIKAGTGNWTLWEKQYKEKLEP
ncbi:MAG TPA: hypothetical protein PLW98_08670 [Bacillota bacterium]|nr:hypothetical protein [Bacillota bacterium]